MENTSTLPLNRILRHSEIALAIGLLGTLVVMILPMPPMIMDFLLVVSITMSIAILMVSIYANRPLDFSVFPTILLFSTLFRLALNVASTRLVLLHGHEGPAAAGRVIETFGSMVVGGSYVVGTVIFILLIIINFVVITKGSGRVAEVAARFILDAMPGKQMSIDADLNAGLITEDQARERRKKIESEADFYGAMDGASKFVRGDAIAGVLITVVNIVGGLTIGMLQKGLDLERAAQLYSLMTIGDGLVSQIPSLIVSTAAGIIVTRAASGGDLSKEVTKQLLFQPRAVIFTSAILLVMSLIPGVPFWPFATVAAFIGAVGWVARNHQSAEAVNKKIEEQKAAEKQNADSTAPPEIDMLELQVGFGLVALVEGQDKGDLVDRIVSLRKEFAGDLGIIVPKVRIKDNLELQPSQYSILIKGISVGGGELMPGYLLAMDPGGVDDPISGIPTQEPVFGLPALWINEKQREKAQIAGYTVVDPSTIIATHLSEIIRKHAFELLGRQELQGLVDRVSKTHPKVVEELKPEILPLGTVLKVCQNLLREQVPVRDMLTILETLANHAIHQKDPEVLTEFVRSALARTITHRLTQGTNEVEVLTLDPQTEEVFLRGYQNHHLNVDPSYFERFVQILQGRLEGTVFTSGTPVLLCHSLLRSSLKRAIERFVPNLSIVSANEISAFAKLKLLGSINV